LHNKEKAATHEPLKNELPAKEGEVPIEVICKDNRDILGNFHLIFKTLIVILSLVLIDGFSAVTPCKNFWVTDAEARGGTALGAGGGTARGPGGGAVGSGPGYAAGGTARGVGGGAVGTGPGYGGARVAAPTPRSYVYPDPR
jgi:hypothetical protein